MKARGFFKNVWLMLLAAALIAVLPASAGAFKGEITVPIIYDATGPNSAGDLPLQKIRLGLNEWWNANRGGIAGYKVILKGVDFSYDMSKCMTLYKGFMAEKMPAVIISASGPAAMIKPMANKSKTVTIMAPTADVCYLNKDQKESYIFSCLPMYFDIYRTFIDYIMEVDWPKQGKKGKPVIGGFNADASFGKEVDRGLKMTCEKYGLTYVPTWCKFGITEASSQVAILKEAKCDYVIGMQLTNESMVLEKESSRMDFHPQFLLHGPHEPTAVKDGYAINAWGYNFAGGQDTPGGKTALELWKKYAPEQTPPILQWAYGFMIPLYTCMGRVIEKQGLKALTGENIKAELEKIKDEDLTQGLTAPWTYTQRDHSGPQAIKYQKCLDKEGNLYTTDWIPLPNKTPEQLTEEYYKK
ncbi:MAG: ABC transporter substrate-binding protein [Proteobacteria bacterium]|nr:ABC transporter substrate-binding protein [Pseudomonadota bacterium]